MNILFYCHMKSCVCGFSLWKFPGQWCAARKTHSDLDRIYKKVGEGGREVNCPIYGGVFPTPFPPQKLTTKSSVVHVKKIEKKIEYFIN